MEIQKEKVGIITLYFENNNYGGMAQAYALQKLISDYGFNAELISYQRNNKTHIISKSTLFEKIKRNTIKGLISRYYRKLKNVFE